jgi:hypothetical protein
MAILHNKAGQELKDEANRRFIRFILLIAGMSFLGGTITAFCLMTAYFGPTGWAAPAAMLGVVALLVLLWWTMRWMDPVLDKWAKERIAYLRGGQGEALVAWLLKDLEDDWHVFNNVKLESEWDIDHIVIGPGGVWCISTKSHRGLFRIDERGELTYNNQPCNWLADVTRQAMSLKQRLAALLTGDMPYVEAALAVPLGWVEGRSRNGWLLNQDNLTNTLRDRRKVLDKAQIHRCVKSVEMLTLTSRQIHRPVRGLAGVDAT